MVFEKGIYMLMLMLVCFLCAFIGSYVERFEEQTVVQRKIESCKQQQEALNKDIEQIKLDHKNTMVRANQVRDKYNKNDDLVKKLKEMTENMKKEIEEMKPKIPELTKKIESIGDEIKKMKKYLDQNSSLDACK